METQVRSGGTCGNCSFLIPYFNYVAYLIVTSQQKKVFVIPEMFCKYMYI